MSAAPRLASGPPLEPIQRVLDRLTRANCDPRPVGAGKWESICPAHKGSRRNLSIATGTDGAVLLRCHHVDDAGQSCPAAAIVDALGLELRDLFVPVPGSKRAARAQAEEDGPGPASTRPARPPSSWVRSWGPSRPATGSIAMRTGPPMRPSIASTWPTASPIARCRSTRPRARGRSGTRRRWLPYRLPEIAGAERVYFLEGEKIVELARALGLVATTTAHGAQSPQKTDLSALAGKEVVVIPDNDPAGEAYAAKVLGLLAKLSPPARVKLLRLDLAEEGDDLEQWIEARGRARRPRRCGPNSRRWPVP